MVNDLLSFIFSFFSSYSYLMSFLGSVGGEVALLFLVILALNGQISYWSVFVFFTLGTLVLDVIWFFIGRLKIVDFKQSRMFSKKSRKIEELIDKSTGKRYFLTLLFGKFIYGTRILTLLYVSLKKMSLTRFLLYNLAVIIIWVAFWSLITLIVGSGIMILIEYFKNIQIILLSFLVIIIALYLMKKWIDKKFTQKLNR